MGRKRASAIMLIQYSLSGIPIGNVSVTDDTLGGKNTNFGMLKTEINYRSTRGKLQIFDGEKNHKIHLAAVFFLLILEN